VRGLRDTEEARQLGEQLACRRQLGGRAGGAGECAHRVGIGAGEAGHQARVRAKRDHLAGRQRPVVLGDREVLVHHATALERQTMLHGIEQSLMPGETGKRSEKETADSSGDVLSAHFHDYDWADEVLHTQIGRRWVRREGIEPGERRDMHLRDVAPTVLDLFGLPRPATVRGRILVEMRPVRGEAPTPS